MSIDALLLIEEGSTTLASLLKGGLSHPATDDLGNNAVKDVTDDRDLHAAVLHLSGVDHTMLTYRFRGREFRLTDVHGTVVSEVPA